jgi:hypothetical protein
MRSVDARMRRSATPSTEKVRATNTNHLESESGFWDNVCGGIFELWRIPGKEHDVHKFMQVIDGFDNKVIDKKSNENVSSSEVMDYMRSTDQQFDESLFSRI